VTTPSTTTQGAPLCFIDTETTGVHPGRQAWEIAMIRRDPDGVQSETLIQVLNVDLSAADPFGLKVGGFYDRHFQFAPFAPSSDTLLLDAAEAATVVERVTRGAHLVGAVPNFDAETLDPMLRRGGLIPAWHYHLVDVEALAVGWLAGRGSIGGFDRFTPRPTLPWKSDDLSRACGVEPATPEERHTALGDARWAMRLYDAIIGTAAAA